MRHNTNAERIEQINWIGRTPWDKVMEDGDYDTRRKWTDFFCEALDVVSYTEDGEDTSECSLFEVEIQEVIGHFCANFYEARDGGDLLFFTGNVVPAWTRYLKSRISVNPRQCSFPFFVDLNAA